MVENLERLIESASRAPRASRAALFRELLRSETYLLTVDDPLPQGEVRKVAHAQASFPVWADRDAELGGVWVPVFPARDRVRDFVAARGLRAPRDKEFLWMGHAPGQVFGLLRGVRRFAGIRLHLDARVSTDLSWTEVFALSEGRLPDEAPELYELPVEKLTIPAGVRLSFGRLKGWPGEDEPRLMFMPEAGRIRAEDARRLVRLPLGEGWAWTPCRHFLQILRRLRILGSDGSDRFPERMLAAQIEFRMYGEAEALCDWALARGRENFAWLGLSVVYGRTKRYEECAQLCGLGAAKYPGERAFHANGLRALIALGRREEAARRLDGALKIFPEDEWLRGLSREWSSQAAPR